MKGIILAEKLEGKYNEILWECIEGISNIAAAVGRSAFQVDAKEIIEKVMEYSLVDNIDEQNKTTVFMCYSNFCKSLENSFCFYLPIIMQDLIQTLSVAITGQVNPSSIPASKEQYSISINDENSYFVDKSKIALKSQALTTLSEIFDTLSQRSEDSSLEDAATDENGAPIPYSPNVYFCLDPRKYLVDYLNPIIENLPSCLSFIYSSSTRIQSARLIESIFNCFTPSKEEVENTKFHDYSSHLFSRIYPLLLHSISHEIDKEALAISIECFSNVPFFFLFPLLQAATNRGGGNGWWVG